MDGSKTNYIIYDTETTGLDVCTVDILQISIIDGNSGDVLLNQYVLPYNGVIAGTHIHGIDEHILKNNNAISLALLFEKIVRILRDKFGRQDIVWVAYNNFGYDQLVFESNCKKANCRMPDCWKFMDLLPFVRNKFTHISPNYKLASVYKTLIKQPNNAPPIQFHNALADTLCLFKVFQVCQLFEEEFHLYIRPKLDSMHILNEKIVILSGYHHCMNFEKYGFYTLGDMYAKYRSLDCRVYEFSNYLTQELNVRVKYRANQMAKEINMIHILFGNGNIN